MLYFNIEVKPELIDPAAAIQDAEDLAWEHAKIAVQTAALNLGGDAHEFLYKEMSRRYQELTEYLEFLTFNGLVLVRALLESNLIKLSDPITSETKLAETLGELSQIAVSSYCWMIAGYELLWPANNMMPETGVCFKIPLENITFTQEPQ